MGVEVKPSSNLPTATKPSQMRNFRVEIIYIVEGDGTHLQTLGLKTHYLNFYCSSQALALRKGSAYDLFHILQILGESYDKRTAVP